MVEAVDLSHKRQWNLVRFSGGWGSKAVTDRDSDFVFSGVTYTCNRGCSFELREIMVSYIISRTEK